MLILQNDLLNQHLNTVIVAPITSNLKYKGNITTFFLDNKSNKLGRDSLVLLLHLRSIDKSRLKKKVGQVSQKELSYIKRQLGILF